MYHIRARGWLKMRCCHIILHQSPDRVCFYLERQVFNKDVNNENDWNFEFEIQSDIIVALDILVDFLGKKSFRLLICKY